MKSAGVSASYGAKCKRLGMMSLCVNRNCAMPNAFCDLTKFGSVLLRYESKVQGSHL